MTYKHSPRTPAIQSRRVSRSVQPQQDLQAPRTGALKTPHAIRASQQRHAAATTPARNRRRSGRAERETPRDVLRKLSRGRFKTL